MIDELLQRVEVRETFVTFLQFKSNFPRLPTAAFNASIFPPDVPIILGTTPHRLSNEPFVWNDMDQSLIGSTFRAPPFEINWHIDLSSFQISLSLSLNWLQEQTARVHGWRKAGIEVNSALNNYTTDPRTAPKRPWVIICFKGEMPEMKMEQLPFGFKTFHLLETEDIIDAVSWQLTKSNLTCLLLVTRSHLSKRLLTRSMSPLHLLDYQWESHRPFE